MISAPGDASLNPLPFLTIGASTSTGFATGVSMSSSGAAPRILMPGGAVRLGMDQGVGVGFERSLMLKLG